MTAERRLIDRRAVRVFFRYPERRTGFDRRSPGRLVTWYRDHPAVIGATLTAIMVLNVADLLITLWALENGAREANPVMAALLTRGPVLAGTIKLAVGLGVVAVIWMMRRYRRILEVSLIAVAGFGLLLTYQVALVIGLR